MTGPSPRARAQIRIDERYAAALKPLRNIARASGVKGTAPPDYPTFALEWEAHSGRDDPEQRYALYRLCECPACSGTGKRVQEPQRCLQCRGEGRTLELLATAATPEAAGVALVTLAREGEFEECPLGLLDRQPEEGQRKWLVLPWLPSPRNVSDAGRTLRASQRKREEGVTTTEEMPDGTIAVRLDGHLVYHGPR